MKKTCSKCGETKELTEFHKKKSGKFGVSSACRVCLALYQREYRQNNKEKLAEYEKEYYQNNREKRLGYQREYRQNNKEELAEYFKKYRQNNKEKLAEYVKEYRRKNPHIYREDIAKRRAAKRKAVPLLCETNRKLIRDIYKQAPEGYHIDHIVPLIGKRGKKRVVCGLHVPWNLEPVPAEENLSKSYYTWPDMWTEEELGV